jgi:hypothetical protein
MKGERGRRERKRESGKEREETRERKGERVRRESK